MVSTHAHNKFGYPKWRPRLYSCQTVVLLTQWFTLYFHLSLQILCKTVIEVEFIMAYTLVKSLAVNRTKTHISLPDVSAGHMCKGNR